MMISPEGYYECDFKGKSAAEIKKEIESLKQEIAQLKYEAEKPGFHDDRRPDHGTIIDMSREYLKMAVKALKDTGEEYIPDESEKRSAAFDKNIPYIRTIHIQIGSFPTPCEYSFYLEENPAYCVSTFPFDKEGSSKQPFDREEFLNTVQEMHMGEWRETYDPGRYGIIILDGESWEIEIEYSNGARAERFEGYAAYPYNFELVQSLIELVEEEE